MDTYFFVGHRGSGKNFLTEKLKEKYNITHIDTGPLLRKFYIENFKEIEFKDWIKLGEQKYGKEFTNMVICKQIEKEIGSFIGKENEIVIIIGNRSMDGIKYIVNKFNITDFKIIFIDAPLKCLKDNYNQREGTSLTDEEFEKIIQLEKSMGIDGVREYAKRNPNNACYIYKEDNNTFSIEEYEKIIGIDNRYLKIKGEKENDEDFFSH